MSERGEGYNPAEHEEVSRQVGLKFYRKALLLHETTPTKGSAEYGFGKEDLLAGRVQDSLINRFATDDESHQASIFFNGRRRVEITSTESHPDELLCTFGSYVKETKNQSPAPAEYYLVRNDGSILEASRSLSEEEYDAQKSVKWQSRIPIDINPERLMHLIDTELEPVQAGSEDN